ncbi:MAG: hypothetical protein R3320_11110, partial [Nitriliruptorales bacterium]|nr:hypothetical protein [Nitriliruptorales bacterium]
GEGPLPSASRVMCPKCVDGRVLVGLIATRPCDDCDDGYWPKYQGDGSGPPQAFSRDRDCPSCGGRGSIPTAKTMRICTTHRGYEWSVDPDTCTEVGPEPCEWVRVVVIPWKKGT